MSNRSLAVRGTPSQLRAGRLHVNSLLLLATAGLTALSGFVFWIEAARFYPAGEVGVATSLISALNVLSYVALLGFNVSFVKLLPHSPTRDADLTVGVLCVFAAGCVVGIGYLAVWRWFIGAGTADMGGLATVGFAVAVGGCAVNLVTDAVFVGLRRAEYNFVLDGLVMSLVKVALPVALVGLGAIGVVYASGLATLTAALLSVLLVYTRFGFRPDLRGWPSVLARGYRFLGVNYVANLLNLVPVIVLPAAVLRFHGAERAAWFFIPFQIATLVNAISYAVCQSMFAEAAKPTGGVRRLVLQALVLQLAAVSVVVALLWAVARPVLGLFGESYAGNAVLVLRLLLVSALPVALTTWGIVVLRILDATRPLVLTNVVYVVVVLGVLTLTSRASLTWAAIAWGAGNLAAAVVALVVIVPRLPRPDPRAGTYALHPEGKV